MATVQAPPRSADVALGFAVAADGSGIAYFGLATGWGRAVCKVSFTCAFPEHPGLHRAAAGFAAIEAVARWLRSRSFTRIRVRLDERDAVDWINGRFPVPPPLAMAYVRAHVELHKFAVARIEIAEPSEVHDLNTRSRVEIELLHAGGVR